MTYTTKGSVRGNCGHKHRSIVTAHKCLLADHVGCKRQGGYSDRYVCRTDDSEFSELEQQELEWLEYVE
jgi:hypothetical protein